MRAPGPKCSAFVRPPPGTLPWTRARTPAQERNRRRLDLERALAGRSDLRRVADQAKTGNVGARVHGIGRQRLQRFARRAVQRRHGTDGSRNRLRRCAFELDGGRDDSGPERFCQKQLVAGLPAGIRPDLRREHFARHCVAELDLGVLHGVTAKQRHAGLRKLLQPAFEDGGQNRSIEVLGERGDRQRRERTSAHRVYVAQGIGGSDLTVHERIVDDGGEEIDGLYERTRAVEPVHTRIV